MLSSLGADSGVGAKAFAQRGVFGPQGPFPYCKFDMCRGASGFESGLCPGRRGCKSLSKSQTGRENPVSRWCPRSHSTGRGRVGPTQLLPVVPRLGFTLENGLLT